EPVLSENGISAVVYEYDDAGRTTFTGYLDTEGNPTNSSSGFCFYRNTYGEDGSLLQTDFYDADGTLLGSVQGP
ncbi:MAG: hypothetical protein II713_04205, partial [Clostridia bacterium]|nr:hypothetical protein [Clostridia bacterium]